MVIADAVLFVRKQISRARGSIQIVAVFIWEFYKWLYVIARILVRYVTGIIVFQIVPQLARKFCCSYSQWNWKTREWDVGDKTNWYKKLSKNKNQKKWRFVAGKKKKKEKKHTLQISLESNSSKRLFSAKIKIIIILWLLILMFSYLSFNRICIFYNQVSSYMRKISFLWSFNFNYSTFPNSGTVDFVVLTLILRFLSQHSHFIKVNTLRCLIFSS